MVLIKDFKILIAGAVPSVINYLYAEFKKGGAKSERVMNSTEILPKIDEIDPDIIVIDLQMEEVSTYQIIEKVKSMKKPKVYLALYSFFGEETSEWGNVMAASALTTIPILLLFLPLQARLASGLSAGAVKQ